MVDLTYYPNPVPENDADLRRYINDELQNIRDVFNHVLIHEDWHEVGATNEPAFQNSWVSLGTPHNQAGFYKDPFGIVRLQGHITGGTGGATAFTLPSGYYSGFDHEYINYGTGGGTGPGPGGADYAIVLVDASGNVQPDVNTGADVSLDGIFFRI